jgi:hypothetical protein
LERKHCVSMMQDSADETDQGNFSKVLYSQHHGHSHIPRLEPHILCRAS